MDSTTQELSIDVYFKTPDAIDRVLATDPDFNRLDSEVRGSIRKMIEDRFIKDGELVKIRFDILVEDGELSYVDPRVVRH